MSRDNSSIEFETVTTLEPTDDVVNSLKGSFLLQNVEQQDASESEFVIVEESSSKLIYQGQQLTHYRPKEGGKNNSKFDGFYKDANGVSYFVKKPSDIGEFFSELFAGKIIEKLKQRKLIPEVYHRSLIIADCVKLPNGEYALIQPAVKLKELFKIIGTGNLGSKDRSVPYELIKGVDLYRLPFVSGNRYFGLSWTVMIALLVGDYSLHSANIVSLLADDQQLESSTDSQQYGKIDWGAAFRYFVNPKNHEDILLPEEYRRGTFNFKSFTKGYVGYYSKIPDFFDTVQQRANQFSLYINEEDTQKIFKEIIQQCLTEIPDWIVQQLTIKNLKYFGFNAQERQSFGKDKSAFLRTTFVSRFSETFVERLSKLGSLDRSSPTYTKYKQNCSENSDVFQSTLGSQEEKASLTSHLVFSTAKENCICCDYQVIKNEVTKNIKHFQQTIANPPKEITLPGQPVESQLEIIVSKNKISLELGEDTSTLSDYVSAEMIKNSSGKLLLAIPIHLQEHGWGSLMLYIEDAQLISVSFMNCQANKHSFNDDDNLFRLFSHLKIAYPDFNRAIHYYVNTNENLSTSTAKALTDNFDNMMMRAYFGRHYNQIEYHRTYQQSDFNKVKFNDDYPSLGNYQMST